MGNNQYKLNNTEKALRIFKKPYDLNDDFIEAIKQAVFADIKENSTKKERKSFEQLADERRVIKSR